MQYSHTLKTNKHILAHIIKALIVLPDQLNQKLHDFQIPNFAPTTTSHSCPYQTTIELALINEEHLLPQHLSFPVSSLLTDIKEH